MTEDLPAATRHGQAIFGPPGLTGPFALLGELDAWIPTLPASAVFTGLTAAQVWQLWMPPLPADLPRFVAMGRGRGEVKPVRPELRVSRHPQTPGRVLAGGVPVATVPELLVACARVVGLLDVITLVDSALHDRVCSRAELEAIADRRLWGAPRLRAALLLGDGRSESPWETILRLFHVAAGVPVIPQVDLHDSSGRFVARADLLLEGTRSLHEYDGEVHRDLEVHRGDLRRDRRLVAASYVRRGYIADDLRHHPEAILADCSQALGRRLAPSRLAAWQRLTADSLYFGRRTPQLTAMLQPRPRAKRVALYVDSGA
jgi:hypothetical protein